MENVLYIEAHLEWDSQIHSKCRSNGDSSEYREKSTNDQSYPRAVEFKLYGDKQSVAKVLLYQSSRICTRYEVSSKLRETLLPGIKRDPTLDEVVFGIVDYAQKKYLVKCRKNMIELDEKMKEIFGDVEQIPTSQIGDKLIEYQSLKPLHKLYQVDIPLSHQASLSFPIANGESIYDNNNVSKLGGRVFDIEIDLIDEYGFDSQFHLNNAVAIYDDAETCLSRLLVDAQSVSSKIENTQKELDILFRILRKPLEACVNRHLDLVDYTENMNKKLGPIYSIFPDDINAGVRDIDNIIGGRKAYFRFHNCHMKQTHYLQAHPTADTKRTKIKHRIIEIAKNKDKDLPVQQDDFHDETSHMIVEPPDMRNKSEIFGGNFKTISSPRELMSIYIYYGYIHAYQGFLDVGNDDIFPFHTTNYYE